MEHPDGPDGVEMTRVNRDGNTGMHNIVGITSDRLVGQVGAILHNFRRINFERSNPRHCFPLFVSL